MDIRRLQDRIFFFSLSSRLSLPEELASFFLLTSLAKLGLVVAGCPSVTMVLLGAFLICMIFMRTSPLGASPICMVFLGIFQLGTSSICMVFWKHPHWEYLRSGWFSWECSCWEHPRSNWFSWKCSHWKHLCSNWFSWEYSHWEHPRPGLNSLLIHSTLYGFFIFLSDFFQLCFSVWLGGNPWWYMVFEGRMGSYSHELQGHMGSYLHRLLSCLMHIPFEIHPCDLAQTDITYGFSFWCISLL